MAPDKKEGAAVRDKKILICGEKGTGKSILIQRLIEDISIPVYGFITKKKTLDIGPHPIYIHPADSGERRYGEENLIGLCDKRIRSINEEVFNTLGVEYLSDARPGGVVVMDELGFMEARADEFVRQVLKCLDGDVPVIAAVKARHDIDFLNKIRSHPNCRLYTITPDNREQLYEELRPVVMSWGE